MFFATSKQGNSKWLLILFLIMGLGFLGWATYNMDKNLRTPWHIVTGYVEQSEVVKHASSDGVTWSPLVLYNYTYFGEHYKGTYKLGYSSSDYSESQRVVAKYPPGTQIEVKVNPADLSDSRIKQDFVSENSEWLFLLIPGFMFTSIPVIIYLGPRKGFW